MDKKEIIVEGYKVLNFNGYAKIIEIFDNYDEKALELGYIEKI